MSVFPCDAPNRATVVIPSSILLISGLLMLISLVAGSPVIAGFFAAIGAQAWLYVTYVALSCLLSLVRSL